MMLANLLHSINQLMFNQAEVTAVALNLMIGLCLSGLFIYAFFLAKKLPIANLVAH